MVADHIDIQRITPVREFLAKYCDPETFAAANGAWGVSMAAAEFRSASTTLRHRFVEFSVQRLAC